MADPKTVRQWLETLPEPYRTSAIQQMKSSNRHVFTLTDAIIAFCAWHGTKEGNLFWHGLWAFVSSKDVIETDPEFSAYTAAKAAFEAQQKPEPVYTTTDTHKVAFRGKGGIYGSSAMVLPIDIPNPETLADVTYIPVAPDDHAELIRKAAAYDDFKAVIDRLDCEIQDLKKRFV